MAEGSIGYITDRWLPLKFYFFPLDTESLYIAFAVLKLTLDQLTVLQFNGEIYLLCLRSAPRVGVGTTPNPYSF